MNNDDNYMALRRAEHTIRELRLDLGRARSRLRDISKEAQKALDLTAGHTSDHAALRQWVEAYGGEWARAHLYAVRAGVCLASLEMIRIIGEVGAEDGEEVANETT